MGFCALESIEVPFSFSQMPNQEPKGHTASWDTTLIHYLGDPLLHPAKEVSCMPEWSLYLLLRVPHTGC